jgi:hypothetical protein
MNVRFFKPTIDSYEFSFSLSIAKLIIFEITIGKFYALTYCESGIIIIIFGFTLQITKGKNK